MAKLPYTAEEIAGRLDTTTGVFFGEETPLGAPEIAAVQAVGITRIEVCGIGSPKHFDYGNPQQAADIVRECHGGSISWGSAGIR